MASSKKPPWFAKQQPDGPIPLASFEEDLYDTASETTTSPESECQDDLPPLPSAKHRESSDLSDNEEDVESQDGTLTPKSPTNQSKDDSYVSSRDELSTEEFGSALTSPKTPTARGLSPLTSLFKWRPSSPRGSPKKSHDSSTSPSICTPSDTVCSPVCSTPPRSPRWKREGKAFLSFFKFGDKKQKGGAAKHGKTSKSDGVKEPLHPPQAVEPDLISSTKISSPLCVDNPSVPIQNMPPEAPSPGRETIKNVEVPEELTCDLTLEVMEVIGAMQEEQQKHEEPVESSEGEENVVEDLHSLKDELHVDHEAQNLLSQESLEYDDVIEVQMLVPMVTKSEPITPTRRQRLEVVTIPVERPRSATPMSVAPLEAFIASIERQSSQGNVL